MSRVVVLVRHNHAQHFCTSSNFGDLQNCLNIYTNSNKHTKREWKVQQRSSREGWRWSEICVVQHGNAVITLSRKLIWNKIVYKIVKDERMYKNWKIKTPVLTMSGIDA